MGGGGDLLLFVDLVLQHGPELPDPGDLPSAELRPPDPKAPEEMGAHISTSHVVDGRPLLLLEETQGFLLGKHFRGVLLLGVRRALRRFQSATITCTAALVLMWYLRLLRSRPYFAAAVVIAFGASGSPYNRRK